VACISLFMFWSLVCNNSRHSDSRLDDDHYGAYNVSAAVCITTVSYVADERTLKYIRSAGLSPDGGRAGLDSSVSLFVPAYATKYS